MSSDDVAWRRRIFEQYASERSKAPIPAYTLEPVADVTRFVPQGDGDEAPMSRPILEHRGFRFVCHTYPMRTRPFEPL